MPIKPECRRCTKELLGFGGLLFSPPEHDSPNGGATIGRVLKSHLCSECYDVVTRFIDGEIKVND